MSDTSTPFGTVATGLGDQTAKANALFDAVSPAAVYGLNSSTTTGLVLGLHGGKVVVDGVVTVIADYTGTLTASLTNYVEANPATGAVTKNTTCYTPGYWRIGRGVATTTAFTWYDDRFPQPDLSATLAKALTDANTTLTQPEASNAILTFTGTLSTTRDIVVPLVGKRQWTVYNGSSQSLRFIGATGTGITVATLKHAIVRSDGTNIVRVTADT